MWILNKFVILLQLLLLQIVLSSDANIATMFPRTHELEIAKCEQPFTVGNVIFYFIGIFSFENYVDYKLQYGTVLYRCVRVCYKNCTVNGI